MTILRHASTRRLSVALAAALVAGNALLHGGVRPVTIALSALLAAAALALSPRRREGARAEVPALALGLLAATLWIALQLVPLPPGLLRALSPAAAAVLDESLGPLGLWPAWRPLSLDPGATAVELAKAAAFTAVGAAAAILASSERRRTQLLRGVALSGALVAAVYYGAALLGLSPLLEPRVAFVNTNHLAGFLLLTAFPALGFALRARGPERVGWILAFAFTASGVFLSLSRGGIAAFFVGAGIFGVIRMRSGSVRPSTLRQAQGSGRTEGEARGRPSTGSGRTEGEASGRTEGEASGRTVHGSLPSSTHGSGRTVAAGALAAALAVASWLAFDPIVAEMRTLSEERTTGVKLALWPAALDVVKDFPLTGVGRGAFATVYPAYKTEPARVTFTHVENEWLQLPVDLGLVAGGAVVLLFGWAFLAAARRRDLSRPLAGALAGAGALAAQNLFDFSLEIPGVAIPFALVLGIASASLPRLAVPPWAVRAAAVGLLLLAAAGLALHRAEPPYTEPSAVAAARTGDEAAALARGALRWHPADWLPHAATGVLLAGEDRCAEALPWLTRAMRRNPTAPEPHRAAAGCLARGGKDALAKAEYRLAFLLGDPEALAEAAALYDGPGELLAIAPDTPEGLLAAGRLLRSRPAEAQEAWRRAWESFGNPHALAEWAQAKAALGEGEEALRLARLLQERAPRTGAGYAVAARALDLLGRGDEALKELELGASRLPGDASVLVPLGLRQLSQRRFSQARATFEGIVAKDGPLAARRRVLVARALEGQGRLGEALREAQAARELAPDDGWALETFARLAAGVGRHEEAIEALERAARLPGAKPGAHDARLGELREALEEQRRLRVLQGTGAR